MALDWLWWRAWVPVDAVDVAGVALGDIDLHFVWQAWHLVDIVLHFAWQAWHLVTSTFTLRGRRGMALDWLWWRAWVPVDAVDAAAVCVAGVALGDIDLHFVWQAWHLVTSTFTLRGRRGTYGTGLALVARLGPS